jgi:triosephosphate isomerase
MPASLQALFIANWKMNMLASAVHEYAKVFLESFAPLPDGITDTVICPPFTLFGPVSSALCSRPGIKLGAQNVHWLEKGAYTGEISPLQLVENGVSYAIVGHSERRQLFGETDEFVAKRAKTAIKFGIRPVVCVGESLYFEDEQSRTSEIIKAQLQASLAGLNTEETKSLVVAYEPIWAIGTGRAATPEIVARVHRLIRTELEMLFGQAGRNIPILYGGSTTADNIGPILSQPEVNGALVGSTSLKPDEFAELIRRGRAAQD